MPWLIGASVILLFFIGSMIALWWWRLATRLAPYEDERHRTAHKAPATDEGEVVVISRSGESRPKA